MNALCDLIQLTHRLLLDIQPAAPHWHATSIEIPRGQQIRRSDIGRPVPFSLVPKTCEEAGQQWMVAAWTPTRAGLKTELRQLAALRWCHAFWSLLSAALHRPVLKSEHRRRPTRPQFPVASAGRLSLSRLGLAAPCKVEVAENNGEATPGYSSRQKRLGRVLRLRLLRLFGHRHFAWRSRRRMRRRSKQRLHGCKRLEPRPPPGPPAPSPAPLQAAQRERLYPGPVSGHVRILSLQQTTSVTCQVGAVFKG